MLVEIDENSKDVKQSVTAVGFRPLLSEPRLLQITTKMKKLRWDLDEMKRKVTRVRIGRRAEEKMRGKFSVGGVNIAFYWSRGTFWGIPTTQQKLANYQRGKSTYWEIYFNY